ncbi:hypothetical protein [Deinococcus sp. S9]|uniref:hypothetical protein n=1 Tax=Deinococcus sp. S9 TaxID=2545754 RepID=UPI0010558347|nr:hypothetical protein [Deinococcus sp. S9]TDE84826.1 hypothetical protein E0686_15075 [Deinococcus sp. S9]
MTTPITHNSRNPQRLQRCILNLAYRPGGITQRQLAKLLGLGLSDVGASIQGLLMDGRLYETRTDRQTSYHTTVLQLEPHLERPEMTLALVSYLGRQGQRQETARYLAPRFGLTADEARANLERAVADGLAAAQNVGRLRLYRAARPAA